MKPVITNGVGIISPQGFLDSSNASSVISFADIEFILQSDINAIFISLKQVVFFNATAIQMLSDTFVKSIMLKKNIGTGFCDYDSKKFPMLLKYLNNEPKVILLENTSLVHLFYAAESHEAQKVLVWNENATQKGMILYRLLERGCLASAANSKEEYESCPEGEYNYKVENCYMGGSNDNIQHYTRSNIVVYIFSNFIDTERLDGFDNISHRNYLRMGFGVFIFDFSMVVGINTHAVNFFCRLASTSSEYGAHFIIVGFDESKIGTTVKKELESYGILFKLDLNYVFNDESVRKMAAASVIHQKESKKGLTKQTIKALNSIVEATIDTLEVMTKLKSKKLSIKMTKFELSDANGEFMAASIVFYGHIEGVIVLVFQKDIAKRACSILLGSEDVNDIEIIDSIGELVNITMGKAKTALSHKDLTIKMTLPRTFKSREEIDAAFKSKDGVLVEFLFSDSKFVFFLTI